jgi:hypothetical protein
VQDLSDLSVVISDVEIRLGKGGCLTGLASLTCHDEGDDPEKHMHGVGEISNTDAYTGPSQVLFGGTWPGGNWPENGVGHISFDSMYSDDEV